MTDYHAHTKEDDAINDVSEFTLQAADTVPLSSESVDYQQAYTESIC